MKTNYKTIEVTEKDAVSVLTLNRPSVKNALSTQMIEEIHDCLQKIQTDSHVRLLILKAHGSHFCAGADLNDMQRMIHLTQEENEQDALLLAQMLQTLAELPLVTLAIIHGPAYGGGVGLVSCCDIAIATPEAHFCLSEVKLGLIPAVISPYVLAAIGSRQARRYFLTAEIITAEQAKQIGLVHDIVTASELLALESKLTKTILKNAPQAIADAKKLIRTIPLYHQDQALLSFTAKWIAAKRVSEEGQEGLNAFLEKRNPRWMIDAE